MRSIRLLIAAAAACLAGCGTTTLMSRYVPLLEAPAEPRVIVIAIDGTGSDLLGRSNVGQLHGLLSNQDRDNLSLFYTEGVGTDGRIVGAATGWGMGWDVRQAYQFLSEEWTSGAKLYVTGFSRGAYSVRVLAGLVAAAGIADLDALSPKQREQLVHRIYSAYVTKPLRGETPVEQNARRLRRIEAVPGFTRKIGGDEVLFEAAALWDTVAAIGAPDRSDDPLEQEQEYAVGNCNFKRVFHAVSLDDNRAYSFTPISVLRAKGHPDPLCSTANPRIEEVWFSGAHADVGGAYTVDDRIHGYLPGVSLRWMLSRLKDDHILPAGASAYGDPFGPIHDAKAYSKAYKAIWRRWRRPFELASRTGYSGGRPVLHRSVVERLAVAKTLDERFPACRNRSLNPKLLCHDELREMPFLKDSLRNRCLTETAQGYVIDSALHCFVVVDEGSAYDPGQDRWLGAVERH